MKWQSVLSNKIIQIIMAAVTASLIGFFLSRISLTLLIAFLALLGVVIFLYKTYNHYFQPVPFLLVKFLTILGFIHTAVVLGRVGPFSIFPYRALVPIVLLIFIIQFLTKDKMLLSWEQIRIKPILLFFVFWICYGLFSLTWVKSLTAGVTEMLLLTLGISFIFLFVFYFSRLRDYLDLYYIWLGMLVILLSIGVLEILTGQHSSISTYFSGKGSSPTAVFANENDYATYLTISFFFIIPFIKYMKNYHLKLYGILLALISLYVNYITHSRANFLALLVGLICYFLFLTSRKGKMRILIVAVPVAAIMGIVFHHVIGVTSTKLVESFSSAGTPGQLNSIGIRLHLIHNSLIFLSHTFGFGIGSGNAEYYMGHYEVFPTGGIVDVHNWWIEILVQYGLFVFVGYILVFVTLIVALFRSFKRAENRHEKMICEALLGALFAFPLASISPSSIMAFKFQWIFFAFAIGFLNYFRLKNRSKKWRKD